MVRALSLLQFHHSYPILSLGESSCDFDTGGYALISHCPALMPPDLAGSRPHDIKNQQRCWFNLLMYRPCGTEAVGPFRSRSDEDTKVAVRRKLSSSTALTTRKYESAVIKVFI